MNSTDTHPFLLSCEATSNFPATMIVDELKQDKRTSESPATAAVIGKRLISVRLRYCIVVAVFCWFGFALALFFLRVLGFLDAR